MQTDWLIRQLSLFTQIISHILGLKKRQRYEDAQDAIVEALGTQLGLGPDALRTLSITELMHRIMLTETAMAGREKCLFIAALLKESADIYVAQEQFDEAATAYLKALQLMLDLRLNDDFVVHSYTPQIETLLNELDVASLPLDTQSKLMVYYEQTGAYGKAEDLLFEMLDAYRDVPGTIEEIVAMGISFYEQLQQQNDDSLIAGNLPRAEVASGLAEVRNYL